VATAPSPKATPSGPYWVQVGAFKDPAAAKRLAERLREQKYQVVEESPRAAASSAPVATPSPAPPAETGPPADRYDVFVSAPAPADISAKLGAKGLTADPVSGGVVVKPSLPLRDAVVLSRDLAADGLKVQVRRSGAAAAPAAPAASPAPASGGDTFYRVRIGSFPDRPTAQTVLRELEGKGYKAFIARGSE
jgi:cell division septation protein DedD